MRSSHRVVIAAGIAAVALGLGLFAVLRPDGDPVEKPSDPLVVQPGAPGQAGRTLSAGDLASVAPPRHGPADTQFIRRMIPHHAQALQMTALVKDRHASPELPAFASRIEISQQDEIAQMERWLADRGEPAIAPHASHPGHDTLMPGMLNDQDLAGLERARGAAFDRLFLELMIRHHQGALAMVRELYVTGGGLEPASDRFAREVNADQDIEIRRMRDLLARLPSG